MRPSSSFNVHVYLPAGARAGFLIALMSVAFSMALQASEEAEVRMGWPVMPERLDLETAKALALEHNQLLKQVKEGLDVQDGVLRELQSARRPQLDFRGGYRVFDEERQGSFGSGRAPDNERWDADADASIAIYSGGRNKRAVLAEEERKDAVSADLDAATQELLAQVHETYYDAQLARETVRVQEEFIALLKEQLKYAQQRFDVGVGERFDVVQAEVSIANARPPLIRAQNDYRRNVDTLRRILGLVFAAQKDAQDIVLDEASAPEKIELDLETSVSAALENRPELEAAGHLLEAAREDVEVVRRLRAPLVDLFANYGAENDQFGDVDVLHGWTVGGRVRWTLWDGGESKGLVMQRSAELRRLEHEKKELELAIASEVRQAFYDYEEAQGILASSERVVNQADEALRLAHNRYRAGRGTQLDVLESQVQLTRSRLEQSTALNSLQRAVIRIHRAMGHPL
jgi:outer membrane protein TolC